MVELIDQAEDVLKSNDIGNESSNQNIVQDEIEDPDAKHLDEMDLKIEQNSDGLDVICSPNFPELSLTLQETVGRGNFCKVKRAIGVYNFEGSEPEIVPYAVKVYEKSRLQKDVASPEMNSLQLVKEIDLVMNEMRLWGKANHQNVIKVFTLYELPEEDKMYLMMQYSDYNAIAKYDEATGRFTIPEKTYDYLKSTVGDDREKIVKFIFQGVVKGLHYLHEELQLANRDIKPDNILFTTRTGGSNPDHPDRAQITDFTTVVKCKGSNYKVNDDAGTLAFKPPECIWSGAPYCPKAFDVWSLGVSIYCLMFEQLPFNRENLQHEIKNGQIDIPFGTEELKHALERMLIKDPQIRAKITEIAEMDWFQ